MRCCSRALMVASLAPALVICGVTPAAASEEQHVSLTYEEFYGGIRATSLEVDVTLNDRAYRLESKVVAHGPFGWLTGFVAYAATDAGPLCDHARTKFIASI